jgi:hypothetical protein
MEVMRGRDGRGSGGVKRAMKRLAIVRFLLACARVHAICDDHHKNLGLGFINFFFLSSTVSSVISCKKSINFYHLTP